MFFRASKHIASTTFVYLSLLLLTGWISPSQAQECSREFSMTSSFLDSAAPAAHAPGLDTVDAKVPAFTRQRIIELTEARILGRTSFFIYDSGDNGRIVFFSGSSITSRGSFNGVRNDSLENFTPLIAVADAKKAYGLGVYEVRNNLTGKAVRVRVEVELDHNIQRDQKDVRITGITRWSAVEPIGTDSGLPTDIVAQEGKAPLEAVEGEERLAKEDVVVPLEYKDNLRISRHNPPFLFQLRIPETIRGEIADDLQSHADHAVVFVISPEVRDESGLALDVVGEEIGDSPSRQQNPQRADVIFKRLFIDDDEQRMRCIGCVCATNRQTGVCSIVRLDLNLTYSESKETGEGRLAGTASWSHPVSGNWKKFYGADGKELKD